MSERPNIYVISVLVKDCVGIIADVSELLYELGGNLEALSQTVIGDWFTMCIRGAFPSNVTGREIERLLESTAGLRAVVAPAESGKRSAAPAGEPFVVTVLGADKPGIVRRLTRCLADKSVNIEDVWNEVQGDQFIVIFKVSVSASVDPSELRLELEQAASDLGFSLTLQHNDIFVATNSISV